ncbi:hypothetical protein TcCL_Unassigned07046, partial [Trypanosoma cruzi]
QLLLPHHTKVEENIIVNPKWSCRFSHGILCHKLSVVFVKAQITASKLCSGDDAAEQTVAGNRLRDTRHVSLCKLTAPSQFCVLFWMLSMLAPRLRVAGKDTDTKRKKKERKKNIGI